MKNYFSIPFCHIKKDEISAYFKFTHEENNSILDDFSLDEEEEHTWSKWLWDCFSLDDLDVDDEE